MVSTIGGASLAQSLLARVEGRKAQETGAVATTTASVAETGTGAASTRSAQTQASARVGAQLDAQFEASRLQQAPAEGAPPAVEAAAAPATGAAATTGTEETEASASAAPAAAGGAQVGGGASSSSESAETDYIAEADTNNDRKVSEQERIAYAKKQEVQQAYLPQETAGAQLDIKA